MNQEIPAASDGLDRAMPLLPVLICSILSASMLHINVLSFFFLCPLGYMAVVYNASAAWFAFIVAAITNVVFSFFAKMYSGGGVSFIWIDIIYFTVMSFCFTWIMANGKSGRILYVRTAYRFIIASVCITIILFIIALGKINSSFFYILKEQASLIASIIISSAGPDTVRRSYLEQNITADFVYETIKIILLRGGLLVSVFSLFFINRQLAKIAAALFRKRERTTELHAFHVPGNTIWILSFSLLTILLARFFKLTITEIVAWNVLIICALLFLAQGAGIFFFVIQKRGVSPAMRIVINVFIFVVIFTPGVNTIALVLLLLLGIAENWAPFRAPGGIKQADGHWPSDN